MARIYSPGVQITLAYNGTQANAADESERLVQKYLKRTAPFANCQSNAFRTEEAFLAWLARQSGRTPATAVLLDSRGKQMSSEVFAAWLGSQRDEGTQHLVFAIGPASGWSEAAKTRARILLSMGPFTLAHSLARVVMAEQIYRASTILTGHPYHTGH